MKVWEFIRKEVEDWDDEELGRARSRPLAVKDPSDPFVPGPGFGKARDPSSSSSCFYWVLIFFMIIELSIYY